jgi:asparagine synthetase B (glutamine-hydrolysing)
MLCTQEELPPGLYSVQMDCGVVQKHAWRAAELLELAAYSRQTGSPATAVRSHADELLSRLDAAVARRVARACSVRNAQPTSVLVLFSGGVDSALLAALAHRHVAAGEAIDLANVCFNGGASADRQAARAALCELRALAPQRTWRLIEVDGTLELVAAQRAHLLQLLHPRDTVMDLNIGSALWLAAHAEGVCDGAPCTSAARIVLLGTGADEQAAGYSRHRASFNRGGDAALVAELEADVRRLWLRNLGRDDRLISDCGREARFPFLDEAVMACLAQVPLCELADLRRPPGCGDKLLIRAAARALGLDGAAQRVKRAIQFGSGLSRLASVQAHGSGRAANARGGGKCSVNAS